MGYVQTTTGVTSTGPLPALAFTTPICPQYGLQLGNTGNGNVNLEISMDGVNFIASGLFLSSAGITSPSPQSIKPLSAIRANVTSITGTIDITVIAAPLNSE